MDLEKMIGKWGICTIGKRVLHENDKHKFDDYPFKGLVHQCIGIENGYLKVRFSGIILRVLPNCFSKRESPPNFLPFDKVKYISSKKKLEFGVVVDYASIHKPQFKNVYILEVRGKVKTTLYGKERLSLLNKNNFDAKFNKELGEIIFETINSCQELEMDEMGWVKMEDIIKRLPHKVVGWEALRYYDILRMIDSSEKKEFEVKAKRIEPKYKNKYEWYIRMV